MTIASDKFVERHHAMADCFRTLQNQLRDETDRGAVIVAVALLEDSLEQMLSARLIPSPERDDELFSGPYAPLGNFSAKIDFAYRVGLIRQDVRSSFHLLRKLRNHFAHSASVGGFEAPSVRSRLRELFKLNRDILDSILESLTQSGEAEMAAIIDKAEGKEGLKGLVALLDWRGVFNLLTSLSAAALSDLPNEIVPLEPLWQDTEITDEGSA